MILRGTNHHDRLIGSNRADTIYGDNGHDIIRGRGGSDLIQSDKGNDTLYGGFGADTFFFTSASHGRDTIGDFKSGVDMIDLTSLNLRQDDVTITRRGLMIDTDMDGLADMRIVIIGAISYDDILI